MNYLHKKGHLFFIACSFIVFLSVVLLSTIHYPLYAAEENLSPKDLIVRAWEAWGAKDHKSVFYYTDKCIELYSEDARAQQTSLTGFPATEAIDQYDALNAVGTSLFIQGEAYLTQGKIGEAKEIFVRAIEGYGYAQNWDPRGWFWSVKEKSEASLEKLEQKEEVKAVPEIIRPKTKITLHDQGKEFPIDYSKYGYFKGIGTNKYRYVAKDPEGLAEAAGEGVYPNTSGITWDPRYREVKEEGRLEGNHWDFVNTDDLEANFYRWTQAAEPMGVRMFYAAMALENSGLLEHAIKAYYSIVVHFPKAIGWTYFHTPWYIAQVAIDRIDYLLRHNPDLKAELHGAKIFVENGFDDDITNDKFFINPGRLSKMNFFDSIKNSLFKNRPVKTGMVVEQRGDGRVDLVKYKNGHWQLRVEGRPYIVKGVAYDPNKIGQSPDEGTLADWMQADYNNNGRIDAPYDSWVDKNFNNTQDADEETIGDFGLLKEMGANTIRIYHHASNKELLKDLYDNYGIMSIMGDLLGAYTVGSGASWYEGTDYENPEHRETMKKGVRQMVEEFKDEPYVLFWMLGNENNYGVANNAKKKPDAYYTFVNEIANMIRSIDRDHPVAVCSGDLFFLDKFAEFAPDVDIYGSNAYRGRHGFGRSFWGNMQEVCDKPIIITEYGCPSYMQGRSREHVEEKQAEYLRGNWEDILYNSAGHRGIGNSIGGVLFEWLDEWWKAYEPMLHDTTRNWSGPFPDGWNYEEWLGVAGQGDGKSSPFLRQLKKAYFVYQEMWTE
ncbi:MAG: glycoside hydrolase family 2 TIM barrel-domain containing protein [Candidatus Gorgyraea atricola]|nr:glycoside hydrolase family 2 TIM barrel-domain containing protein [Candidatus Gorgyraea atricola]